MTGANRLKFTPDGKLALVLAGPALVILDAATHKEVKRLPIGHGSGGILMQPDGARAYVACGPRWLCRRDRLEDAGNGGQDQRGRKSRWTGLGRAAVSMHLLTKTERAGTQSRGPAYLQRRDFYCSSNSIT